jgi:integrase
MQEQLPLDALGAALPPEFDDLRPHIVPLLAMWQKRRRPSEKTLATYEKAMARMVQQGRWPEEMGKRSRRSFQFYRAAFVHMAFAELEIMCRLACSRQGDVPALRQKMIVLLRGLKRYPPDNKGKSKWERPKAGVVSKSKRNGMLRVPGDGLVRLVASFADDPVYADPLRVLFLTGCRPCELVNGAEVRLMAGGFVRFTIQGGKVTEWSGQPARVLDVAIDNAAAQALAKRAAAGPLLISIEDARKLSDKVRGRSRRLFPGMKYLISPYTFRHAVGAREKARGRSVGSLAQSLGHVSGQSQRSYGTPRQGGLLPGHIHAVAAARPVRKTDVSQWREVAAAVKPTEGVPALPDNRKADAMAQPPGPGPAP